MVICNLLTISYYERNNPFHVALFQFLFHCIFFIDYRYKYLLTRKFVKSLGNNVKSLENNINCVEIIYRSLEINVKSLDIFVSYVEITYKYVKEKK
jgi:hypothetical protein